jgi:hypothetical protein
VNRHFTVGASFLAALLVCAAAGCGTGRARLTPAVRQEAVHVALIDGVPMPPYRKLGAIETIACARTLGEEPDREAALSDLKVEAARLGGNAAGNIMCSEESAGSHRDCWKIVRCTAEADCASRARNPRVDGRCR